METRLDKASKEQQDRSAFECETCDIRYGHTHDPKTGEVRRTEDEKLRNLEEISKHDPSPFGP